MLSFLYEKPVLIYLYGFIFWTGTVLVRECLCFSVFRVIELLLTSGIYSA